MASITLNKNIAGVPKFAVEFGVTAVGQ